MLEGSRRARPSAKRAWSNSRSLTDSESDAAAEHGAPYLAQSMASAVHPGWLFAICAR